MFLGPNIGCPIAVHFLNGTWWTIFLVPFPPQIPAQCIVTSFEFLFKQA